MAAAPRPVAVLDGALTDRVRVYAEQRGEGRARRALTGRQRAERLGDRAAQLLRRPEIAVPGADRGGQRAGPACPGDEVGVAAQVVLLGRVALDRVGEVQREVAAPELDVLDRTSYHQTRVYP